jgi:hypothetical protein
VLSKNKKLLQKVMKTLLLLLPPVEKFDDKDKKENRFFFLRFLNWVVASQFVWRKYQTLRCCSNCCKTPCYPTNGRTALNGGRKYLARLPFYFRHSLRTKMNSYNIRQWRKGFPNGTGKKGLDNCGKNAKKADLAQRFPVLPAAGGGAAAVEGESLRQASILPSIHPSLKVVLPDAISRLYHRTIDLKSQLRSFR